MSYKKDITSKKKQDIVKLLSDVNKVRNFKKAKQKS